MSLTVAPLQTIRVTSSYGLRDLDGDDGFFDFLDDDETFHHGTDLAAAVGTPVFAMGDGVVRGAGAGVGGSGGGNAIDIVDDDDGRYVYLHLSSIAPGIRAGARVRAGQLVGRAGKTGVVTGPHLHIQWQPDWPSSSTADLEPLLARLRKPAAAAAGGGAAGLLLLAAAAAALSRRKRR